MTDQLLDLDNQEVSQDLYDKANEMTALFHEHCQKWARQDDFPAGVWDYDGLGATPEYPNPGRYYWGFRATEENREEVFGWTTVSVYVAVSDELGGFDLVGFYEEGKLVYLIARVDTEWAEVGKASFPHGFVDLSKPYERVWAFTNLPPETKEAASI